MLISLRLIILNLFIRNPIFLLLTKLPELSASLQQLREALDRVGYKAIDYFSERAFEDEHGCGISL